MRTDCHCGASHHQEHCSGCLGKAYATITVCAWCGYELDAWNRPNRHYGKKTYTQMMGLRRNEECRFGAGE